MAIIQPTYVKDYMSYRYPDAIENNGLSDYNFFYTPISKVFLFKESKSKLTEVKIDLLLLNNLVEVNPEGTRS